MKNNETHDPETVKARTIQGGQTAGRQARRRLRRGSHGVRAEKTLRLPSEHHTNEGHTCPGPGCSHGVFSRWRGRGGCLRLTPGIQRRVPCCSRGVPDTELGPGLLGRVISQLPCTGVATRPVVACEPRGGSAPPGWWHGGSVPTSSL